jgi:signal transduction histidine kinase
MIRVQREVAEALQAVAEDAGDSLAISVVGPVPIRGDVHRLRQTIVNLVENAIRHTPPGTAMTVEARVSARDGLLIVSDNGPGIPAGQHEAVIRRFARLESAGGRAGDGLPETAGQGLGLTLVDAIARLHHGVLIMQDAAPGPRVVIALPLGA